MCSDIRLTFTLFKIFSPSPTESVYDLLPKELQLPPSRETTVASMSQTSGGEAGSPPPAVVAAGMHFILLY